MPDPRTFEQLSYLLQQRDQVEYQLELMHDDRNAAGEPLDPKRNIEPRYDKLSQKVVNLKRAMFTLFVDFLATSEPEHASQEEQTMLQNLCRATDKWDAAVAMQPEVARGPTHGRKTLSTSTAASTKRSSPQPKASVSGRNARITKEQNTATNVSC
jgi:hypothetical protein